MMNIVEAWRSGVSSIFKKNNGYANFEEAKELFETAYEKNKLVELKRGFGKKIGNNTWIVKHNNDKYCIQLHNTEIITLLSTGDVILDTSGWKTPLTKGRLETYVPISIWSHKGKWYFRPTYNYKAGDGATLFSDGMVLDKKGYPVKYKKLIEYVEKGDASLSDNIQFIEDQKILIKIALTSRRAVLVEEAVKKITDEKSLKKILVHEFATDNTTDAIVKECLSKITDVEELCKSIVDKLEQWPHQTGILVKKIKDQKWLQNFVTKLVDPNPSMSAFSAGGREGLKAAFSNIKSQKFLIGIAESIPDISELNETSIHLLKSIKDTGFAKKFLDTNIENILLSSDVAIEQINKVQDDKEFLISLLDTSARKDTTNYILGCLVNVHKIGEDFLKNIWTDKSKPKELRKLAEDWFLTITEDIPFLRKVVLKDPHHREEALDRLYKLDPEFYEKMRKREWGGEGFKEDIKVEEEKAADEPKVVHYKKQLLRLLLPLAV